MNFVYAQKVFAKYLCNIDDSQKSLNVNRFSGRHPLFVGVAVGPEVNVDTS